VFITDPRYLDLPTWAATISADLAPFGQIPVTTSEGNWRAWAQLIRGIPAVAALNVPDPQWFPNWQSWAHQFNSAVAVL